MKKAQHKYILFLLVLLPAFFLLSCTSSRCVKPAQSLESPRYDESSSWLFQESSPQKKIDVFYVYPTIYGDENPPNMDIYKEELRDKARGSPVILPGAFCINPLNWKTDGTPAAASLNFGAVFFKADGSVESRVPHYAGATVDTATGALTTVFPEKLDVGSFPKGVYHIYDYSLWFQNLKRNIKLRSENLYESHVI